MRQTPDRGYILPIWDDKNAYRATADAYMTREGVEQIGNQDGNTYTKEEVKNSLIGYNSGIEFWISMFKPRTDKWKRDTLKRLRSDKMTFGTLQETEDKIKALKQLLTL